MAPTDGASGTGRRRKIITGVSTQWSFRLWDFEPFVRKKGTLFAPGQQEFTPVTLKSCYRSDSMGVHFFLLVSRQGKTRLTKWFTQYTSKEKTRAVRELTATVLSRQPKMCNFIEWQDKKVIYKRYASLYFIACVDNTDNELLVLEQIHLFVEVLDRYFGNVCELDIIFNFHKAYYILDELFIGGNLQETSKVEVLRICASMDEQMVSADSPMYLSFLFNAPRCTSSRSCVLVLVFVFVLVLALLLPSFIVIFISTFKALTCHILSLPFPAPQDDQKEEGTHSAKNSRR